MSLVAAPLTPQAAAAAYVDIGPEEPGVAGRRDPSGRLAEGPEAGRSQGAALGQPA